MLKNKKIILSFLFSALFLTFLCFSPIAVLASDIAGENVVDNSIVLSGKDPRTMAVRIINIAFSFLGIIAVSIVLIAGFLWMTSEGQEEKVNKAKKMLKNALIGLIIILAAWGIVFFIFRALFPSRGGGEYSYPDPRDNFFQNGLGAISNCSVESVYPSPGASDIPRNTMIMVTFREQVDASTFNADNATICLEENFDKNNLACSAPVNFTAQSDDGKIFVLQNDLLGNEDSDSNYVVYLSHKIKSVGSGNSIFANCANDNFIWTFTVTNKLDLTPPQVSSIFPGPDNAYDNVSISSELVSATGSITISGEGAPRVYAPAMVLSATSSPSGNNNIIINATIIPNYNDVFNEFTLTIGADKTKGQIRAFGGGVSQTFAVDIFASGDKYQVSGYNPLQIEINTEPNSGNSWNIKVKPMVSPDSLSIGPNIYYFGSGDGEIAASSSYELVNNIVNALSLNPSVVPSSNGLTINLTAKVAGSAANGLEVSSTSNTLSTTNLSGGQDRSEQVIINDKKDQPKNAIIQINFNEAINPIGINASGNDKYLRVFAKEKGASIESEVVGEFSISSDYKTLEFKTKEECAVNGCGEKIYCLPGDSEIRVEIKAASLYNCNGDNVNCANKSPYTACLNNICTDTTNNKYHPQSNILLMNGVMDAAANSFDANKNTYAEGPQSYYNLNSPVSSEGDNLKWSFWTNNNIEASAPRIESVSPEINATGSDLVSPVIINFNKLMMTSTLKSGDIILGEGEDKVYHRLINLIANQFVGYWITSDNIDYSPLDGIPDKTISHIQHAKFFEGAVYSPQIGSGIKDIYQNCFKPSAGIGCTGENASEPYCCNGVPSNSPCVIDGIQND